METDTLDLIYVEDNMLKATVSKVFQRLLKPVQQDLRSVVWAIKANGFQDNLLKGNSAAGNTGCADEDFPESLRYCICLSREISSEPARIHVVAHEFAHAYLRHPTFLIRLNQVVPYPVSWEQLCEVIEDQANLQVCLWGFCDELIAFHREYPKLRKPNFFDKLSEWQF